MNVNKVAYLTLVVGMVISTSFLALSLALGALQPKLRQMTSLMAFVGVGVLVITPYIGVLAITVISGKNKDFKLMIMSLAVLTIMLIGLLLGFHFRRVPKG